MAIRQAFRGNPAEKKYVLSQNFIGGLNTKEADDVVTDIEFRELLNADLGNQGIITNRKGFKDLIIFNQMMEAAVDENDDPANLPDGTYRLAKVAKDDFNIIQKITSFETLSDFRNSLINDAYELIIIFIINFDFYRLKIIKEEQELIERVQLDRIYTGQGSGEPVDEQSEQYYVTGAPGNEFNEFLFSSYPQDLTFDLPTFAPGYFVKSVTLKRVRYTIPGSGFISIFVDGIDIKGANSDFSETTPLFNNITGVGYQLFGTNNNYATFEGDRNLDVSDYIEGNKLYIQFIGFANLAMAFDFDITFESFYTPEDFLALKRRSKLSENNVEFLDSIYVLPEFESELFEYKINEDTVGLIEPYKPTPFEVKFVGFNVLAENPLTYIADQGISNKNIEGVFLTVDGNKPVRFINGGLFQLNILHTGTGFTTDEVGIQFFVNFQEDNEQEVRPFLVSAQDVGGLFIFEFNASNLSGFDGREITVRIFELDKSDGSDLTADLLSIVDTETTISVADSSPFLVNQSYIIAQPGIYEIVRIKEVVDATTVKIFDFVRNTYLVSEGARLFKLQEKTSGVSFDPFLDIYRISSSLIEIPQAVERLDLKGFKMLEINYRMVYYGRKEIWFSDINEFGYVPNYNFVTLPLGTTDQIQRILFFRGSYIVFTKDEIYRFTGSFGSIDFRVESVNKFVGCIAPNTVRNVGNELFFLSRDGLYKLKSSVFQDNLENVEKIDKAISDSVNISEFVDSLLYDEQYILYYNEGEKYDTLRMFYDINLGRARNPFVRDVFTLKPELLVRNQGQIYGLNNGRWFVYGEGYTDFMPDGTEDSTPFTYPCKIETPSLSLGFPTHQKKFRNIFVKALHGEKVIPLFMTVKVDNYDVLTPSKSFAFVNELGEVEYVVNSDPNVVLITSAFLGELELGTTPLGEITQKVHKLSFSGKGKNIKFIIEQQTDSSFGIISIGYLYKLGKVRE